MLEPILASSAQSSALAFLAAAPERSFSSKELQGRLRLSPVALNRALSALGKLGLVTMFRKAGQKFYLINGRHPRLPEIRAALPKVKFKDELFQAILKLGEIKAAFLSGLFVGQPQLPVDLLLVGRVSHKKLDQFMQVCKKLMGQELNYSIMSAEEFQTRRDTFDRFVKDIFDYRHVVVVDKLQRRRSGPKRLQPISFEKFRVERF